jgi:hypothetical protein
LNQEIERARRNLATVVNDASQDDIWVQIIHGRGHSRFPSRLQETVL